MPVKREYVDMDIDDVEFEKEDDMSRINAVMNLLLQKIGQLELAIENEKRSTESTRTFVHVDDNAFVSESGAKGRRSIRSVETNLIRKTIREYARERLSIDLKASMDQWPVAPDADAREYNEGRSHANGPTNEAFVMDWAFPGLTQWTKDCATIFAIDFAGQHKACAFPLIYRLPIDKSMVKNSFHDYVLYLKRRYLDERCDAIAATEKQKRAAQLARSNSRKRQLSNRRLAFMQHHHFPDASLQMMELLGPEGMSSDESEGEVGTVRTFKIKSVPWRSPELTHWLHRVDGLPTKNKENSVLAHRGTSRKRIISDIGSSASNPVANLPINLYKGEWLADLDPRMKARLNGKRMYTLPKIDDYVPTH